MGEALFPITRLLVILGFITAWTTSEVSGANEEHWIVYTNWTTWTNALYSNNATNQFNAFMGAPVRIKDHPELAARFLEIASTNSGTSPWSSRLSSLAISWLGEMGNASTNALPFLEHVTLEPTRSRDMRSQCLMAVFKISADSEFANRILTAILRSGPTNTLYELALDRLSFVAQETSLARVRVAEFVPPLTKALSQETNAHQRLIIRTLGVVGRRAPQSVATLRGQLTSTNADFRAEAANALYEARALTRDDVVKLGELLLDNDGGVRSSAASVLGAIGTNALPALTNLQLAARSADKSVVEVAERILLYLKHSTR